MMRTYKDIEYTLVRSRRKTASIYIERDGQVSVLVPEKLTDSADRRLAGEQAEMDLPESRRVAGLERSQGPPGLRQRRGLPVPGPLVSLEAGVRLRRAADAEGRLFLPTGHQWLDLTTPTLPSKSSTGRRELLGFRHGLPISRRRWTWSRGRSRSSTSSIVGHPARRAAI